MSVFIDRFGRVVRDLRVSVTGRCNLACTYCMPSAPSAPEPDLLGLEHMAQIARVVVAAGVERARFTGGEPTLRADLPEIVRAFTQAGIAERSMTTNGTLLPLRAQALADAGLQRVNISLDALDARVFRSIVGRDVLQRVLAGIDAARDAGLGPIKVNCVIQRGVNEDQVEPLVEHARRNGIEVRFLEFMPLDGDRRWQRDQVLPSAELLAQIEARWPLVEQERGSAPARTFAFADGVPGRVGVIPTVTDPFCAACDRLRLTADGKLRSCLFSTSEVDLMPLLRTGASDDELSAEIAACVEAKAIGHGIDDPGFTPPARAMVAIGG